MVKEGCADLQHSLAKQPCTGSLSKTSDMTIAAAEQWALEWTPYPIKETISPAITGPKHM